METRKVSEGIMQTISLTYGILAQNSAQRLKREMFGRALNNQTHLLFISKTVDLWQIQLPVVLS